MTGYVRAMTNAFGVELDSASIRRAAAEAVPETVIAAIYLLYERTVDEIASKLTPDELGHVIRLVGRCQLLSARNLRASRARDTYRRRSPAQAFRPMLRRSSTWINPTAEQTRRHADLGSAFRDPQSAPELWSQIMRLGFSLIDARRARL
jgi:hypothetical protein